LQYTLAADRGEEQLADLYDLQHPGVLYLLKHILEQADKLGIPVAVCGEVAGDPRYARLLLALGLREFSMHPARLLEVKQVIRNTRVAEARKAVKQWLDDPVLQAEISLLQLLDQSQTSD
jgi:phosphotransferase system enzyme I (PtsI)